MAVPLDSPEAERIIARLRRLAYLFDLSMRMPGTTFRFGLDPILGLLPGVGDLASASVSVYIIDQARRLGAPRRVLARMMGNFVTDLAVGSVPLAGNIFDFAFRANVRNLRLLDAWLATVRPGGLGGAGAGGPGKVQAPPGPSRDG